MQSSIGTRLFVLALAVLLGAASSMSAARADDGPHGPLNAPPPPKGSGHVHEEEPPALARMMAGGNARTYAEGQEVTYRMKVTQRLQPKGPHPADPQTSNLEILLRETVTTDRSGPLVTLEVTEAAAGGFLAAAEERSALARKVTFRPARRTARLALEEGPGGRPNLTDPETIAGFGQFGEIRMADLALRAHLLNPVLPTARYTAGQTFNDVATLPAGWTLGAQSLNGSVTVAGQEQRDGRTVVRASATHISTDTLLRVRAMDNAVDALQGKVKPDPNEFFAGTLFQALFPKGSTYESLMPPLPLRVNPPAARRPAGRSLRRRPRRRRGLLLACLLMLATASCSDPQKNVDIVSLNLSGPIQLNHQSVLDAATGIVVSSEVTATARLSGQVYPIPDEVKPLIPQELSSLSLANIGMDADWAITEELAGELPRSGAAAAVGGPGSAMLIAAVAAGLLAALVIRRRKASRQPDRPELEEEPAVEPEPEPSPSP